MAEKFIDIPFVEAEYKFDDWIKYLIFMHILPYMLKPASDDWKGFALPISLYIQTFARIFRYIDSRQAVHHQFRQ